MTECSKTVIVILYTTRNVFESLNLAAGKIFMVCILKIFDYLPGILWFKINAFFAVFYT